MGVLDAETNNMTITPTIALRLATATTPGRDSLLRGCSIDENCFIKAIIASLDCFAETGEEGAADDE